MFHLVLFGPPGSGKGTQSVRVAEKFNLVHISTGDIFRREIREKTHLGVKVQGIIERGELVSDELLIEIMESTLNQHPEVAGFVFDGFPRTLRQASDLDALLDKRGGEVDMVVALEVDDREIINRLLKRAEIEGRKDDTREVIENRIAVYNSQTQPLIEYYKKRGQFTPVNGIGSIDEIFASICRVVEYYL
ncbi:MAG: adenylate kinase [Bacteroidales bacterium]|nr:adenylate kinase [Bacteroidales bacterium]